MTLSRKVRVAPALLLIASIAAGCGGDVLGPAGADVEAMGPEWPDVAGLSDAAPPSLLCPASPQGIISGALPVTVRTVPIHDASRNLLVGVDVIIPNAADAVPRVFGKGPYPVVVYSHGSFPWDMSLFTADDVMIFPEFTQYWASKGYIVLAPRHRSSVPGYGDRVLDLRFTLDRAQELVRQVDPAVFLDTRHPVVAGFSAGSVSAALVAGMTLPDPETGVRDDHYDPRFQAGIVLAGVPPHIDGLDWWVPDWTGLRMPLLSVVGSRDLNNEPGTVPDDFLDIIRLSPRGGKHGVMINGAGHFLGEDTRRDAPGTLEASQTATALFLRAYAGSRNESGVSALAHGSFCGLVHSSLIDVEYYGRSLPGVFGGDEVPNPGSQDPDPLAPGVRVVRPGG